MNTRVKICGIQTEAEAMMAIAAGADALGFLVGITHRAEDKIAPERCRELIRTLPPFVSKVMVTHLTDPGELAKISAFVGADTLQLHEDLSVEKIVTLKEKLSYLKLIKAVHVEGKKEECIRKALRFEPYVDAILVDTRTADRVGGTGRTHDWSISAAIREALSKPLILAGGLKTENLRAAIETVNPYGVDVNSGVEGPSGEKDKEKITQFVRMAKRRNGLKHDEY